MSTPDIQANPCPPSQPQVLGHLAHKPSITVPATLGAPQSRNPAAPPSLVHQYMTLYVEAYGWL